MSLQVIARRRVKLKSVTHVHRSISDVSRIKVKTGQVIEPHDVLGEDTVNVGFSSLDIARQLGVAPSRVIKYLERPLGSQIFEGELLASKPGFWGMGRKLITSPADCILETLNPDTGELRLKFLPKNTPLFSGVYGIVDNISSSGDIVIRTLGTEIFGLFGSGKQRFGPLIIPSRRDGIFGKNQITEKNKQQIIVTGALILADALRQAVTMEVSGIIAGGINAKDARAICGSVDPRKQIQTDIGLSLMVSEGYGALPIGDDIFDILKEHESKYAFLSGNNPRLLLPSIEPDSIINIRKVALSPHQSVEKSSNTTVIEIAVGERVRLTWPPFMGSQGQVIAIDEQATLLPSGISCIMATIELRLKKITVPLNNLEVII